MTRLEQGDTYPCPADYHRTPNGARYGETRGQHCRDWTDQYDDHGPIARTPRRLAGRVVAWIAARMNGTR